MINEEFKEMLNGKSVIRELSEYATARGKEIGYENVFDYSLGNPSVPCPEEYTKAVIDIYNKKDPMEIHGYSPSLGNTSAREYLAKELRERFDIPYETKHIFMTSGAASSLAHAFRLVTKPGDEIIGFAPFFPEYVPYIKSTGAKFTIVSADTSDFQIKFDELEEKLNPNVQAILINSPNNPSGVVYSEETLKRLASLLEEKQKEYNHDIFLISDEPYREIVFDGKKTPYPSHYYDNTISCYSYSKGMSLPGERIGYMAFNPKCTDSDIAAIICGQISRGIGHNCPSATQQLAIVETGFKLSDLSVYETNASIIYNELVDLGFSVVKPQGTFYIFPKALEESSIEFCNKAKKYDLLLVPGDSFGCPGYFRMAYCIDTDKVKRSMPVLRRFVEECYR
ncbi:MAG TPA: pyridoxal phosphate-dependent aminotransferase [Lachnospiraceae bacterium]|nr:pyridoxal phosphate-dependent aminotransferase [Lachnospiraceae bacterium]